MKTNIVLIIGAIIIVTAFSSVALASDPTKDDREFLMGDWDNDGLKTYVEFRIGTNPLSSDTDNDGMPDGWEYDYMQGVNPDPNAELNPRDSSDAHLDFDYNPRSITYVGNGGERACQPGQPGSDEKSRDFIAIRFLVNRIIPIVWPSNPKIHFVDRVLNENEFEPPHYDNYEEYYRLDINAYLDDRVFRYIHTYPIRADSDGDGWRDPDDWEPLKFNNDSVPFSDIDKNGNIDRNLVDDVISENELKDLVVEKMDIIQTSCFDINIEIQINIINLAQDLQIPVDSKKDIFLRDADNDGIVL